MLVDGVSALDAEVITVAGETVQLWVRTETPPSPTATIVSDASFLLALRRRFLADSSRLSKADTGGMSTGFWIIAAVIAVGTVAGGLVRMRTWLRRPVPPEVIEAAHRDDDENAD